MTSVSRVRFRPSVFGLLAMAGLPSIAVLQPSANDPDLAALAWVAAIVVLALGFVWPVVSIRSARVDEVGPIPDTDARTVAAVPIRMSGHTAGLEISAGSRESGWYRVVPPLATEMGIRPTSRGVRTSFTVTLRTSVPFGFLTASRDITTTLARPWYVGPAPASIDRDVPPLASDTAPAAASPSIGGDSIRSIRAYVPGDPAHLVHWPSTARAGAPMVRELEQPDVERVVIALDLGIDHHGVSSEAIEAAVQRAAALAHRALARGVDLTLVTAEGSRPVTARCRTNADLRRRLAAATPGRIAVPATGRGPIEVVTP